MALAGGAAVGATRAAVGGALGAVRAGTTMGTAASTAATLGREGGGTALGGMAQAATNAARSRASEALGLGAAAERGRTATWNALNSSAPGAGGAAPTEAHAPPAWARQLRSEQTARHRRHMAMQTIKEGDRGGASATPDIKERD
jgi:type IV secretion system protein TrbL